MFDAETAQQIALGLTAGGRKNLRADASATAMAAMPKPPAPAWTSML